MKNAAAAEVPAKVPKKSNPAVNGLKKGLEKAEAGKKALQGKVKELREGGRYGRAVVDTIEAGIGGAIGGALDGAGVVIPIGEEKHYAMIGATLNEDGTIKSFVDKNGDGATTLIDAERSVETRQLSIPVALPLGLSTVAAGAYMEQADVLETGKGMVAYGTGRLASDAAKAVRALFTA